MSISFLSSKLYIPPVREGAVARPRLVEKMLSGFQQPGSFILLSGPAGFGKTTLLSELAAQIGERVAWLSLEESDNDPNRFWTYLIKACQFVFPEVGETALSLLRASQPLIEDSIPTLLINDLTAQDRLLVLVLDDYHTIQNPSLHTGILFLLDHLPHHLRLVVSTRTDPPWPLSRYRARNQLIEIRAQDLRFTLAEAAAFLNHTMRLTLSHGALAALEERTEGWAAGLQLAALSMQGREDPDAFIKSFTGSHLYIAEYLVDEVLKRQPVEMQAFLLQTSILDRLNAALCEKVAGCPDGQEKLKTLQKANIFIIPLDDEGRWFRYHHLFSDLLNARILSSASKSELQRLHLNAAHWYEQNDMLAEAVEHCLIAGDYAQAAQLVETAALQMILQANVRVVERWLQAIPQAFIEKSPRINMAYAWIHLLRGMPQQALPFIDRLRGIFASPDAVMLAPSLQAEWFGIQAELLIVQNKPMESRDLAIRAQAMLPQVEPTVRSMLYITLAKAYQMTLDYDRAAEVFQMIVQDAQRSGDMTFEVLGTSGQAQMLLKQGRLRRTHEIASEGIRRLEQSGKKVPFSATLFGELGQVYFHWHQFDQSREYLRRSMEMSGKSGYSDPEIYFHLMFSKMCLMENDREGSAREMEQAAQVARVIPPAMIQANVIAQQARVHLELGQRGAAEQVLEAEGFHFDDSFAFPTLTTGAPVTLEAGLVYNCALRILLDRAKTDLEHRQLQAGIDLGRRVFEGELRCQHLPVALETLLLLSQMHALLSEDQSSLDATAQALELAEPEGFISTFIEEGKPIADLVEDLLARGLAGGPKLEFAQEILAAFRTQPGPPSETVRRPAAKPPAQGVQLLVEPLTARELEVLQLIAGGDSNQAIAEKLVITVSAVKKHTGNIYGKLNVNSRTQAVSRARQLGLLSEEV